MSLDKTSNELERLLAACLGNCPLPMGMNEALAKLGDRGQSEFMMSLRRREWELQQQRNWQDALYRLYDMLPVGLCTIDAQLTIHRLNDKMANLCGISRDGLPGHSLARIPHQKKGGGRLKLM
ncbi:MAG: hypothetical protein EA402_08765 [Planctomycetota bacterium]|nr:MAG: hypothetical protein EA402_08765 [Planctomycetota bacterium]